MMHSLVHNSRLTLLAIALLIVAGLGAIAALPRMEDPRITNRIATVITHMPGASAERVESQLSEVIESRLSKLEPVKLVISTSRPGISLVRLELKDQITDAPPVWSRVRDELGEIAPLLPTEASQPSLDDDKGYAFTTLLSLRWEGPGEPDLNVVGRYARELRNRFRLMAGTDYVEILGDQEEEFRVELDPEIATRLNLTAADISRSIQAADAKVAAGVIVNASNQMQIELSGALDSIERIRQIPISHNQDGFIYRLDDLATVVRGFESPEDDMAMVDGHRAIIIAVRMVADMRVDTWSAQARRLIDKFEQEMPANIRLDTLFEQDGYTQWRLGELVNNVLLGFTIIVVVLLLTLGVRAALIVALALPLSTLFTLTCMKFTGLPIHQMSVTGLVVALGIMVDNAIVMVDSIQTLRQQGRSAVQAVSESVRHFWLPLLGSTLTTILAFCPIILMPGPAGEFVGGIAWSVIFSLIGSYLISHTLIAGLAGRYIKADHATAHWYQHGIHLPWIQRLFRSSLVLSLKRPWLTLLVMLILPLTGFISAGKLTEQFFPPSDRDMFQIQMYLAPQSSLEATWELTGEINQQLSQISGITQLSWVVGNNAPSFYYNLMGGQQGSRNFSQAIVTTDDFTTANRLIPELQRKLDDQYPQAQIIVRKLEQGPPFDAPIELRFYGPNLDQLQQLGEQARQILSETPHVIHTRATLQPGTPKIWLKVNEEASRLSGLDLGNIAGQLQASFSGQVQGSVLEANESIPVRVRIAGDERQSLNQLIDFNLNSGGDNGSPLSALSSFSLSPSRGAIPHRGGERVNTIEGYLEAGILPQTVLDDLQQRLVDNGLQLPAGYRMDVGGESAERDKAVGNLLANIGLVMTLLLAVVVLSFNSFRLTGVILTAAFMSVGLGLLCVFLGSYPFGFTVIIGLLGLMGLAINAAIVILAEIKATPAALAGDREAIVDTVNGCSRHIVSTTITTVGGFMPLLLSGGGFWPPFAIAIAGGTALTSLISFYLVPALFVMMIGLRKHGFEEPVPA